MAQLAGHVIFDRPDVAPGDPEPEHGTGRIGIVKVGGVGTAEVPQPDILDIAVHDNGREEIVGRTAQDPITVQTIEVAWEDGTTSVLTELVDRWEVGGNVVDADIDQHGTAQSTVQAIEAATADVGAFAAKVRSAKPYADEAHAAAGPRRIVRLDE